MVQIQPYLDFGNTTPGITTGTVTTTDGPLAVPTQTCPNCGYCPHCKRGNQYTGPIWQIPQFPYTWTYTVQS